jgi:hypothetical protein
VAGGRPSIPRVFEPDSEPGAPSVVPPNIREPVVELCETPLSAYSTKDGRVPKRCRYGSTCTMRLFIRATSEQ